MLTPSPESPMLLRAPAPDDAPDVFAVIEARDRADLGFADFTLADLREVWGANEFDLAQDAALVEHPTDGIVGYAEVNREGGLVAVDPGWEETGVDRRLLEWSERREQARGHTRHRQRIASPNVRARELLLEAGYLQARFMARMVLRLTGLPPVGAPPAGVALRALHPVADARELHALDDLAFANAPDYVRESVAAFTEEHLGCHDHDPSLGRVASVGGQIVAFAISRRWDAEQAGYVEILAVHPDHQRRGIGTALLDDVFTAYARAGLREAQLSVASDNPDALRLYERLGMRERFRYEIYERAAA